MSDLGRRVFPLSGLASERGPANIFDLNAMLRVLRRRKTLFLAVAAIIVAVVLAVFAVLPPSYSTSAKIEINTQRSNVLGQQQEVLTDNTPTTFAIDTQVEVLKGRDLAEGVVRQLNLQNDPEFVPERSRGNRASAIQAATTTLMNSLKIDRSGTAFAIDVSYTSRNPQTAANVVNTLVREYLGSAAGEKTDATQAATRWLLDRINEMRGQVLEAERKVQAYRAANGLLNTDKDRIGSQQSFDQVGGELATAQADYAEKQAAAATARSRASGGMAGTDVSQVLNSDVVTQLRAQRAQISTSLADLEARYGDKYPAVVQARSQLANIDGQIRDEVARIVSGLEGQAQVAQGRVRSLEQTQNQSRGEIAANGAASVKLNDLERDADALRTLYESYLTRYRQTSTQQGLADTDARVLSQADVPLKRSAPKLSLFLAFAIVAGMAGGILAVTLREILDRSLRTPDAIQEKLGLRTLASVPSFASVMPAGRKFQGSASALIKESPFSAFTESLRMLLAGLPIADDSGPTIVVVTSALPNEGKSTVAACLAQVAALNGGNTVLVECDARRGGGKAHPDRPERGLLEVLSGAATLDDALVKDEQSGLWKLPLSRQILGPSDSLGAKNMDRLLTELRRRFALVVLDTPPVMAIADTRLIARKADAVCFVVRWGKTRSDAAETALEMLQDGGAKVVGAVLSHVDLSKQSAWSASDPSAYFSSMKSYYT